MRQERKQRKRRRTAKTLRFQVVAIIFCILLAIVSLTVLLCVVLPVLFPVAEQEDSVAVVIASLAASTIIGMIVAFFAIKAVFKPIQEMIEATEKITEGDFDVEVHETFDARSDFGVLQRSFNNMAKGLNGIELFHKDFINNFSHEFKTPIVSIQGFARQLQVGGLTPEEESEYIAIIAKESDRLAKMSSNILLLSKLESQEFVAEQKEFSLDEQIRTCLLILEKQWSEKNIELNLDLSPVTYRFNEDLLSHVWINLLGNAIKFTSPNGSVSCKLRKEAEKVVVSISDTGKGMTEDEMSHIFESFYQADKSHGSEGNGIGLAIVSRIIKLCSGDITVESQPQKGSTFTVSLPCHKTGNFGDAAQNIL